jgi:hypothetical protein
MHWLKDWYFCTFDSEGLSGGLLSAWTPKLKSLSSSLLPSNIIVDVLDYVSNCSFRIINLYGLYVDRIPFWNDLSNNGFLSLQNLILGGDFNFTLSLKEVWGEHPRYDPQEILFSHWIESNHLIDLLPQKLSQTWCNGRKGSSLVAKLLDHFLNEDMIGPWVLKSKVLVGGISDHMPISIEFSPKGSKPPAPFKFNHRWLMEEYYKNMICSVWRPLEDNLESFHMFQFVEKLARAKKESISWAKKHNARGKNLFHQMWKLRLESC